MTPHDLESLCRRKWGDQWKHGLSKALDVNYRTLNYWLEKQTIRRVVEYAVKWVLR